MHDEQYVFLLYNQFISAKGISLKDALNKRDELSKEFIDWLYDLEKIGVQYSFYAENNGINLVSDFARELNKGVFDSLVSKEQRISPFSDNTELVIYQGIPMIKSGINIVEGQVADIYHTHNPYRKEYLSGLSELHNFGYRICFGIFGRTYDKDKSKKFKLVKDYLSLMSGELDMQYDTERDNYYLIVYNKFKQNVKILRRGR